MHEDSTAIGYQRHSSRVMAALEFRARVGDIEMKAVHAVACAA
jgi:hypothetical protein